MSRKWADTRKNWIRLLEISLKLGHLRELAGLFGKLGLIGFGGPAAHIPMMEEEVVKRRKWITHEHFLDLLGATNLIPGPNSTEMAIHIGYVRAGWRGLIVAGASFIAPAVLISLMLAHLYTTYGSVPQLQPFVQGIRPAILAVILAAVFRLGKPMVKNGFLVVLGFLVMVSNLVGLDEMVLLLSGGALGMLWNYRSQLRQSILSLLMPFLPFTGPILTGAVGIPVAAASVTLVSLGLFFLKIGSILFGSGYVLVAYLQGGLVNSTHWLTRSQLLDAVAVGQFTPGPVLSAATFIGYLILGIPGAAVATVGIFLPSFVFVLISNPFVARLRRSSLASGFLDGVNAASLGLMLAVTMTLAVGALFGVGSWIILLLAATVVITWNINAAWIVAGAAVLGWLFSLL